MIITQQQYNSDVSVVESHYNRKIMYVYIYIHVYMHAYVYNFCTYVCACSTLWCVSVT